ncbi:MAG TPA: NACHT domain-containing protein, partial [Pyrinomonadaceae bacterium]
MKNLLSRKSLLLLAMAVFNVVNVLIGISGNVVSDEIKELLKGSRVSPYLIQITAGLVITGVLLAVWLHKAEKDAGRDEAPADDAPESEKASRAFLANLADRYQTRNAHKLDGRYEISLVVSDDFEGTRTQQFDEEFGADAPAGDAARYIIERFERQGRLLIVGSPGSGKTVLLLTLAQHLAEKAREDAARPLPVIFNLDSWSPDYERFDDWVKAMLTKGYGLSADFAGQLLAERRVVFLLDGLDELARGEEPGRASALRAECLAALDRSLHDGSMSAVICCRREQLRAMLRHTMAEIPVAAVVAVQDLTAGQIDRALIRASANPRDKFAAAHLLAALGEDDKGVFQQVLSTPFYFTTALQVFDSTRRPPVDATDRRALEVNLVRAFIAKKLEVTPNARAFPAGKTLAWLAWLAAFLDGRKRVMFELSDLQPSVLKRPWQYRLLFCLVFGMAGGLIMSEFRVVHDTMYFALTFVFIGNYMINEGLTHWTLEPLRRWRTWRNILWQGFVVGVLCSSLLVFWLLRNDDDTEVGVSGVVFLIMLVSVSAPAAMLMAVIVGAFVRMIIRLFVGMAVNRADSNIVTEDFAQWTFEPLRRRDTWRDILGKALTGSVTGGTVGGGALLIVAGVFVVEGGFNRYGAAFSLFALPSFALIGGLIGAPFGILISTLLGILRACRRTSRFAKIDSPYQRLRAGIVFHILELLVIATALASLLLLFLALAGWYTGKAEFPALRG